MSTYATTGTCNHDNFAGLGEVCLSRIDGWIDIAVNLLGESEVGGKIMVWESVIAPHLES